MSIQFFSHAQKNKLKMDSLSYSLGILIANNLKQQGFSQISAPDLVEGIEDTYNGKAKVDMSTANTTVQRIMTEKAAKDNVGVKEEGEKFLMENAKKAGIVSLPSGLQYDCLLYTCLAIYFLLFP